LRPSQARKLISTPLPCPGLNWGLYLGHGHL